MPLPVNENHKVIDRFIHKMKWCACGDHEGALRVVMAVLAACDRRQGDQGGWDRLADGAPWTHYALYTLDSHEYIEHGGAIFYSWLTDSGEELLDALMADLETFFEVEETYPEGNLSFSLATGVRLIEEDEWRQGDLDRLGRWLVEQYEKGVRPSMAAFNQERKSRHCSYESQYNETANSWVVLRENWDPTPIEERSQDGDS